MSRKRRQIIVYSSPLGLLMAGLWWGAYQVRALSEGAEQLAQTGQTAIRLLKEVGEELAAGDVEGVASRYASARLAGARPQLYWDLVEREELAGDGVRVFSWTVPPAAGGDLDRQLERLLASAQRIESVSFKLDRVERIVSPLEAEVRSVLWLRGTTASGEAFESHSLYRMRIVGAGEGWEIGSQELLRGETVTGRGDGFVDVAAAVGLDFRARRNPLFATPDWTPHRFGIIQYGSAGVSTADVDGDGWFDLFFADGRSSRLYRNEAGRFTDVTAEAGLPTEMAGINVGLFADFDNDGDQDLFLGCFTRNLDSDGRHAQDGSCRNLLFRNNGGGRSTARQWAALPLFSDVTEEAGLGDLHHMVTVATAGDYDRDGRLDLYLGRYLDPRSELPTTLFYTRNGEGNTLLRGHGDLSFVDVTEAAGVREGGLSLGVAWGDYDGDGHPDLYVANDFGRNALLRNRGDGTFADVSEESGTLDFGFGMSAAFGDPDNDGDLDLYVSNVHSGQRWYGQAATLYQYLLTSVRQGTVFADFPLYREILSYAGAEWHDYGDRMIKGNSLLLNGGDGTFADVSEAAGANPFGWYWSSVFLDYDNDGWQDVYAANGWISGKTYDDL